LTSCQAILLQNIDNSAIFGDNPQWTCDATSSRIVLRVNKSSLFTVPGTTKLNPIITNHSFNEEHLLILCKVTKTYEKTKNNPLQRELIL
jgi:hypothetical protein